MKLKLVSNWRKALKMLSVQANVLCGATVSAYAAMYPQLKETLPPEAMAWIVGGMFFVNILLRLIDQGLEDGDET